MMDAYEGLANAIILQAVKDYRKAIKTLKKYPRYQPAKEVKAEVEGFFRSEWYRVLTNVDVEMLIRKLQEGV